MGIRAIEGEVLEEDQKIVTALLTHFAGKDEAGRVSHCTNVPGW